MEQASLVLETDLTVRANRGQLRRLLENLVRNAVEHGGEEPTVTIGAVDDGVYVADDGPGIPVADRDAIFQTGVSGTVTGTALGLGIVKGIADAHGWELRVTDSDGGGVRVEFVGVESPSCPRLVTGPRCDGLERPAHNGQGLRRPTGRTILGEAPNASLNASTYRPSNVGVSPARRASAARS